MATLAELQVEVTALTDKFDKAMNDTKGKIKGVGDEGKKIPSVVKNMFAGFAVASVLKGLGDVAKASINLASDAEETQNKFNVVYSSIADYANDMAIELAGSYGTSIDGAKSMLAGTGDLLTGLGFTQESAFDLSKQVLTLGADLASFTNYSGGAEGASEALTKSLLGEREMLKGLGISINEADLKAEVLRQTQSGLTFETEKQAKANATLTLVMNQSKNAMGDFERSQGSYANQMKIAKARTEDLGVELGRALLPTATKGIGIFSELTGKLASYIKSLNDVKIAEEAQKSGQATKQQELILLQNKISQNEKLLTGLKNIAEAEKQQYGVVTPMIKKQITELEGKISSIKTGVVVLESQIKAENKLAEEIKIQTETEEERKRLRAEAEAERERQHDAQLSDIDKIIESKKTDMEIIDEQIAQLQGFTATTKEETKKQEEAILALEESKRKQAKETAQAKQDFSDSWVTKRQEQQGLEYEILEAERIKAIEEAEALELSTKEIEDYYRTEKEKLDQEQEDKERERKARQLVEYAGYAGNILGIVSDINQTKLNAIQTEENAQIDALDRETLGEEEYAKQVKAIKYQSAVDSWEIEKEQLKISKANSLIEIAINTAVGFSKALAQGGIFGIATGAIVLGAGLAQTALVLSQPEPSRPQLATGAYIPARSGGVAVTVAEQGDEEIFGMGSKGVPRRSKFANEVADIVASRQGGATVNNYYQSLFNTADPSDLRKFNRVNRPFLVAEEQRIGARK